MRKCDKICHERRCGKGEKFEEEEKKTKPSVTVTLLCIDRVTFFSIWESVFGSNCTVSSVRIEEVKQSFWGFSESKYILLRYPLDAIQLFPYDKSVKTCLAVTELVCLFICLYPQYLEGKGISNTQKSSHSEVHPVYVNSASRNSTANEHKTYMKFSCFSLCLKILINSA